MSWWTRRMAGFDLETTGVDPEEARIVTAAIAECGGGTETHVEDWLVDPGVEIPEEAAKVHGITTERARAEGRAPREAIAEVAHLLAMHVAFGMPVVAFNARYDLTVLDRECRRHGLLTLEERLGEHDEPLRVIDPMVVDKFLDRYRKGSRKLDAICRQYGAKLDGAHDAGGDAVAACRAAWVLGAKGQVIRRVWDAKTGAEKKAAVAEWTEARPSLDSMHAAQERWAREQAVGLRAYFIEKGQHEDAASVVEDWPIVPYVAAVAGG